MKQVVFIIVVIFSSHQLQAATRIQFFAGDRNAMVNVTATDSFGNSDSDPSDLYQTMNVEPQDGLLGRGKSITSAERDFNLVCSVEKKQCSLIFNKSANTVISAGQKIIRYKVTGEAAAEITNKFKLNDRGEAYFLATDKAFRFFGNQTSFIFETSKTK
jgi:hypothetical protein